MGLPSDLVDFFSLQKTSQRKKGPDGKSPSRLTPSTIGDFFDETDHDHSLAWEAASVCRRLIDAGVLTAAGNGKGSPPYSECYYALGAPPQHTNPPVYEFLAYGFPEIHKYYQAAVRPIILEKPNGDPDIGTGFMLANRMFVTARHCIYNMRNAIIKGWNPAESPLKSIHAFANEGMDVAMLEFETDPFPGTAGFKIAQSRILDDVMSMGFPQIQGFDNTLVAEKSQISAILKSSTGLVVSECESYLDSQHYLLLSARVKGGNSGGPVIGKRGAVIGVVTHLPADDFGRPDLLGYAAALPMKYIHSLVKLAENPNDEYSTIDFEATETGFKTHEIST